MLVSRKIFKVIIRCNCKGVIMKLIIPMARRGDNTDSNSQQTHKALLKIAGKPMISHLLDSVKPLKIEKVVFIVDKDYKELREVVKKYKFETVFIQQKEIKGVGHAIYGAKKHVMNDDVLIILGDTLVEADLKNISKVECDGIIWTKQVTNPDQYGVVFLYDDKVTRIIEKPENPVSDLAVVGMYYFRNPKVIFNALSHIISNDIKSKGEYQLTDAIQFMITNGNIIKSKKVETWLDYESTENLLSTNKHLLRVSKPQKVESENSIIIRPVYIENGAKIENSVVGPYVSIDKNSSISNSIIKNCIISSNTKIYDVLLEKSVIGKDSFVKGSPKNLNIGDATKIYYQ